MDVEERYKVFTRLILDISRSIQKIKSEEMAPYGLKGKQVQCLFSLYNSPRSVNLGELATLCSEDKSAMSRTVAELESHGLVFIDQKSTKKYRCPVRLTHEGLVMAKIVTERIAKYAGLGGSDLSEDDRLALYRSLTQIATNLRKICELYDQAP